ncbi:MAG TPA: hypothetical protein VF914_17095 [Chloroflexia bacterium]|jgi:hypothetical protein
MMAENNTDAPPSPPPSAPSPALRSLDRLVGTWKVSGPGLEGQVTFEWMEGGFFLMQHVQLNQGGQRTQGIEIIGHDHESDSLKSHYFASDGSILEYTWDVSDDTLTIWFGSAESPAFYRGDFSADGNTNSGAWQWPGGGYESTMTRVHE